MSTRLRNFLGAAAVMLFITSPMIHATDYSSPFTGGSTLSGSDCVYSPSSYARLCIGPQYSIVYLEWIGPGCPYTIWETNGDSSWPYGTGTHIGQTSFPSDGHANMQYDGNFVVLPADESSTLWSSVTDGNSGAYASVEDDGNFVIYSANGAPLWSVF